MKMKRAFAVSTASAAVLLPMKLYVAFALTDSDTGFFSDGGKLAAAALILAVVGTAASFFFALRAGVPEHASPMRSKPAGILAALCGAAVAVQSLLGLLGIPALSAEAAASSSVTVMDHIFFAVGFPASVSFSLAARDLFSGRAVLRRHPLLALLSSVWGCFGFIALFIDYAAAVNRIENVYHTLTAVVLLLFLFSQAKVFSGIDEQKGKSRLFPLGLAAAVLGLTDSLPNALLLCCGRKPLGSFPTGLYFVNLLLAAYILVYLASVWKQAKAPVAEETNVAQEAPAGVLPEPEPKDAPAEPEKTEASPAAPQKTEPVSAEPIPEQTPDGSAPEPLDEYAKFLRKAYSGSERFENSSVMGSIPTKKEADS